MKKQPNVILIYADDLGYGDLSCYGGVGVETPNIDQLLDHGIKFDNAYASSAVCTPSRYSVLTGEYPFRNEEAFILSGDSGSIIKKNQETLAKLFNEAGYQTAVIGKWHLGLGEGEINWNQELQHTPNDLGFDYSFIFPATNDRVPSVYLKNRWVENLDPSDPIEVSYASENPFEDIPTASENPEMLRMMHSHGHDDSIINGIGRIGFMRGGEKARWRDEDLADRFVSELKEFISRNKKEPFFAFYALHQPHVPRVPHPRFVGSSDLGPRGDVIVEMDWCVGELMDHLKAENLLEDTMLIFTSDNGPVLDDGYVDGAEKTNRKIKHQPAGPLRGGKYSKFDGGTRIPFIVSWASALQTQTSSALISQVDFMASFAAMLEVELKEAADSFNVLDVLLGKTHKGRTELLAEGINKSPFLRQGKWSYLQAVAGPKMNYQTNTELGASLNPQLYNMDYDIGQRENVAQIHPERVKEMEKRIQEIKTSHQTRPE